MVFGTSARALVKSRRKTSCTGADAGSGDYAARLTDGERCGNRGAKPDGRTDECAHANPATGGDACTDGRTDRRTYYCADAGAHGRTQGRANRGTHARADGEAAHDVTGSAPSRNCGACEYGRKPRDDYRAFVHRRASAR